MLSPGMTAENKSSAEDQGLYVLTTLLRLHDVGADPEQIRHRFSGAPIGIAEMLRCAREFGLKARERHLGWDRLATTPLPAIAALRDGGFMLLLKAGDGLVLVQTPYTPRPALMTRADLEEVWDGRLVLMTRRAGLVDLSRRFDITWFLGAIHKYRHLLGEVLVASFFLQLFALVSPLFFQVVIDKVLVHRSLSTLDVLVIGLVAISVFEAILGILRTYLFAHTTNRIDVELGARLFRHLLALPIAYFQARRVGDSVARVRELENIRKFLTSSALTLVIDLFFTFVFLAVMFLYSPLLTFIVLGVVSVLHRHLRRRDAAVPPAPRREIPRAAPRTRRSWSKASPASRPSRRWRSSRRCSGAGRSSSPAMSRRASACCSLGNTASQTVQLVNKLVTAGDALLRRQARHRRRPDRRRARRLQHAGRPGQRAGAAPRADVAGFSSGAAFDRSGSATFSTRRPNRASTRPARRCRRSAARSPSSM